MAKLYEGFKYYPEKLKKKHIFEENTDLYLKKKLSLFHVITSPDQLNEPDNTKSSACNNKNLKTCFCTICRLKPKNTFYHEINQYSINIITHKKLRKTLLELPGIFSMI